MELKGIEPRVVEWPPPLHPVFQRALFGARTVPAMRLDGEKVSGSRTIMRRLDELVPDPPLLPAEPGLRARVLEAERWGDEVLQPYGRTFIWAGLARHPEALISYGEHSRIPAPAPVLRAMAPGVVRIQERLNRTDPEVARRALGELPALLDRTDEMAGQGIIGDAAAPNAADLQIASTLRLLLTMEDLRPLIEDRPMGRVALELWPTVDGRLPAGSIG